MSKYTLRFTTAMIPRKGWWRVFVVHDDIDTSDPELVSGGKIHVFIRVWPIPKPKNVAGTRE